MVGRGSVMSIKKGFTLIEVMIAMVVFSMLVGMGSRFISTGISQPFVADRVEPWLQLMENSRVSLQKLPLDSPLLTPGIHKDPFPDINRPSMMSGWQLEWEETSLEGFQAAHFSATTKQNRIIDWHVFHKTP